MKGASILKKFIAGMIFATTIAPILDSAAAVIMTGLEAIKGKWTVKITEYNYQIQKLGGRSGDRRACTQGEAKHRCAHDA